MAELVPVPAQSSGCSHSHYWGDPEWGAQNPTGQGPTQLVTQLPTPGIRKGTLHPHFPPLLAKVLTEVFPQEVMSPGVGEVGKEGSPDRKRS